MTLYRASPPSLEKDPGRILFSLDNGIAIITLNIPSKLNALPLPLYTHIASLLRYTSALPLEECYATVVTGAGAYWCSGADIDGAAGELSGEGEEVRTHWINRLSSSTMQLTKACMEHEKLLIAALNGPAVGLAASILGWFDFLYATEDFFLLTPFTSVGLATEGGASLTFPRRMGIGLANEALLLSRKLTAAELLQAGFLTRIPPKDRFIPSVLAYIREMTQDLVKESLVVTKKLIQDGLNRHGADTANLNEIFMGTERFVSGRPQQRFTQIMMKQRRHKL
ncbi:ClpP/crotonase [Atractiella rhizophila]|nr:ClpP/crotonase [Atractiella rhizophila]